MHTGAFRGPGKTPTKRTLPYSTSDKIPTKHTVRIPRRPKCAREPFGVLGKLTQIDHSLKTTSPKHRKTHGQDARTLTVRTGAFRGPGKTHTKRPLHCSTNAKIPTKHAVRIPGRSPCTREPFGVLGKLTQNEHSVLASMPRFPQNMRSGYQNAQRAHGSLSGSWENSHKTNTPL